MLVRRVVAACFLGAAVACVKSPEMALHQLLQARQSSANLLIQFTKTEAASDRSVMADTDDASIAFAREAKQTTELIEKDVEAMGSTLRDLGFSNETRLLEQFNAQFTAYRTVDRTVLELAIENTNLKAQRLSFGEAQEAADAFRKLLQAVAPADSAKDTWRARALVATAIADVREIQVLQAPHIAEATEDVMIGLEKQMDASEQEARNMLKTIAGLASPSSKSQLDSAGAALDRFMGLNAKIVTLSRRNTNVRSLALSLGQKRTLAAACETSLRALQDALSKRDFTATR